MSSIRWGHWVSMDTRPQGVRKKVRGGEMLVLPSPYDIPEAVRAGFDFETSELIIQFKYIEQDAPIVRDVNQLGKMYVGRHSGRLLGISIFADGFPQNSEVARAAAGLKRALSKAQPTRPEREVNFRLAQRGFEGANSRAVEALTAG